MQHVIQGELARGRIIPSREERFVFGQRVPELIVEEERRERVEKLQVREAKGLVDDRA
jgi:hypothetical protein